MTIEGKKQECRDILERAMDGLTKKTDNPSWFDWGGFTADLIEAMKELEGE